MVARNRGGAKGSSWVFPGDKRPSSRHFDVMRAIRKSDLSATHSLVLVTLEGHADRFTGEAWPSAQTIANESRLGLSTVKKALRALVTLGWLTASRWRSRHGTVVYIVTPPKPPAVIQMEPQEHDALALPSEAWRDPTRNPFEGM